MDWTQIIGLIASVITIIVVLPKMYPNAYKPWSTEDDKLLVT